MAMPALALASYFVFGVLILLGLPLMAVLALFTFPFDRNRTVVGRTSRILAGLVSLCFPPWRMKVRDVPRLQRGKRYVFVSNHESALDILLISRLPWEMKWMAKASLFKVPVLGQMFTLSGDIPVDRGDKHSGSSAMNKARAYVERGMPVMLFPEGTRSRDGELRPFKPGAFRLAVDTGAIIVPIAVYGTAGGMPVGSPWIRPTRAIARVLPVVSTEGLGPDDVPALMERVRAQISEARGALIEELGASEVARLSRRGAAAEQ